MTVRVNKDSFNLREKLSELERPIGLKGSDLMSAATVQEARDFVSAGRKNMVINGSMDVNQRSVAGAIANAANNYIADRFMVRSNTTSSGVVAAQVNASASSNAPGFRNWLQVDVNTSQASLGASDYARIQHYVEGNNCFMDWGLNDGYTDHITLSFWAKSHQAGTHCISLEDGDASPVHVKEYEIKQSGVWQKVTVTFPPPNVGSFRTRNIETGLRITWCLATGTTYQTTPNVWSTSYEMGTSNLNNFYSSTDNYFYLTGVQLEKGKNATDFEYRSYGEELALCQRYYFELVNIGGSDSGYIGPGHWWATDQLYVTIPFPVEMRTVPTYNGVAAGTGPGYVIFYSGGTTGYLNASTGRAGIQRLNKTSALTYWQYWKSLSNGTGSTVTRTAGQSGWLERRSGSLRINFSAEL